MIVDFPHPDGPTNATFYPANILKLMFSYIIFSLVGYLNETFLNSMSPLIGIFNF